jgi:hypothetical protein
VEILIMIAKSLESAEPNGRQTNDAGISEQVRQTVARYEMAGPRIITYRMAELDSEWNSESALQLGFAAAVLGATVMETISGRKWRFLTSIAACFMMEHIIQGWCPPLSLLRLLGFRTPAEIDQERMALKIVRGDFADVGVPGTDEQSTFDLLRAVEER